jgi:hypothetical protein
LPLDRWILALREHFENPLIGGERVRIPNYHVM